jgi:hypothetical protein
MTTYTEKPLKFRTFRIIMALVVVGLFGVMCVEYEQCSGAPVRTSATTSVSSVVEKPVPPPPPPPAPAPAPPPSVASALSAEQIRRMLDAWVTVHSQNKGRSRWENCMPDAPFRATAVKFPPGDHARYSSKDQSLWSQIRVDTSREGWDDQKWLLKDGHPCKLERLDRNGRVIGAPEHFCQ